MVTGKLIAYEGGVGDVTLIRPDGTGRRALHGEALSPRKYAFDRLGTLLPSVTLLDVEPHRVVLSMLTERCALLGAGGGLPQSASSRWSSKMGAGSIIRCSVQVRYVASRGEPVDHAQPAVSSNASIRLRNVVAAPFSPLAAGACARRSREGTSRVKQIPRRGGERTGRLGMAGRWEPYGGESRGHWPGRSLVVSGAGEGRIAVCAASRVCRSGVVDDGLRAIGTRPPGCR